MREKQSYYTSSNKNHNDTFLSHKNDIELNHKKVFENSTDVVNNNRLKSFSKPFDLHELRRAVRETKKTLGCWY